MGLLSQTWPSYEYDQKIIAVSKSLLHESEKYEIEFTFLYFNEFIITHRYKHRNFFGFFSLDRFIEEKISR